MLSRIKDLYYGTKMFFVNIWRFRKQLWHYRAYDAEYGFEMLCRSLEITRDFMISDKPVVMDAKQTAREIDYFLKMVYEKDNAIEIAEKKFNFDILKESPIFLKTSYTQTRSKQERDEVFTKVCSYSAQLEKDRWNKAITFLRKNMQSWWD